MKPSQLHHTVSRDYKVLIIHEQRVISQAVCICTLAYKLTQISNINPLVTQKITATASPGTLRLRMQF